MSVHKDDDDMGQYVFESNYIIKPSNRGSNYLQKRVTLHNISYKYIL